MKKKLIPKTYNSQKFKTKTKIKMNLTFRLTYTPASSSSPNRTCFEHIDEEDMSGDHHWGVKHSMKLKTYVKYRLSIPFVNVDGVDITSSSLVNVKPFFRAILFEGLHRLRNPLSIYIKYSLITPGRATSASILETRAF